MNDVFASDLPESIIKRYSIRVKELGGINLGQGIPPYPTPPHVIAAAKRALDEPGIGIYPNFLGQTELRTALIDRINSVYSLRLSPDSHILITVGAMEAFASSVLSIIRNGEKVGVITPDYCNHIPAIQLARGALVEIPMHEGKTWELDMQAVERAAKSGLTMLVLTNPGNPTGVVFDAHTIDRLVHLSNRYGFWIVSDETYGYLDYESKFSSMLSQFTACERLLIVNTFSKEYAMTGWRVGYLIAREDILSVIAKTHDALVGCVPKISQRAAHAAVTGPQESVHRTQAELKSLRDYSVSLADTFMDVGTYAKPEGAYYLFLRYKKQMDSIALTKRILEEAHVAVIPGSVFGRAGEGHLRISYAVDKEKLTEGLHRIGTFLRNTELPTKRIQ